MTNELTQFFWDGAKVAARPMNVFSGDALVEFLDQPSLDNTAETEKYRWGKWIPSPGIEKRDWKPIPYDDIPKAFKLALVVMGVDTRAGSGYGVA